MSLPPHQPRKHLHTRRVTYCGYQREDGLWEIEAEISDTKTYALKMPDQSTLQSGTPVHDMAIRVTLDDSMTICEIVTSMSSAPFPECSQAKDPMQLMIGCTMGPGWRQAIEKQLGDIKGCTHLRELLFNMATVAYQTIPSYRKHQRIQAGLPDVSSKNPPFYLGKCMAWDFNGPVVKRYEPDFHRWQPLKKIEKTV